MAVDRKPSRIPAPRTCPECGVRLGETIQTTGKPAVCASCAAVFVDDMESNGPRLPRTQEWYDWMTKSAYNHVWDERERIIERLSTPVTGKP